MLIIYITNAFTITPGQIFQNIGTAIKLIPLIFIIVIFWVMIIVNLDKIDFNQDVSQNQESFNVGVNPIALIFMTIPPMLFAFDGFIVAGSLSKESKSRKSFRLAFIFSIAVFGLGDASKEGYGTIANSILNIFGDNIFGEVLSVIASLIILLSIMIGASGYSIITSRMLSDLSIHNAIADKKGKFIAKNKYGVAQNVGLVVMALSFIWLILFMILDGISVSFVQEEGILNASNFSTDLVVIIGFVQYIIIIISAVINRFTNKVKVYKNKLFLPASIFAIVLTTLVVAWFSFTTIAPYQYIMDNSRGTEIYWTKYAIHLFTTVVVFIYFSIASLFIHFNLSKLNKDDLKNKLRLADEYYY